MQTCINKLKLREWTENDIYTTYLDGKSVEEKTYGDKIKNEEINNRVEYLKKLTEIYIDCWYTFFQIIFSIYYY